MDLYEAKPVGCYHQNWQNSVRSQGGFGDELISPSLACMSGSFVHACSKEVSFIPLKPVLSTQPIMPTVGRFLFCSRFVCTL